MNVNYSETLSQAFVVGPDELKKLVELLQKRIGEVSISADCIDNIQREFTTVKDLMDYENPKSKRICRIYLSAHDDFSKSATVAFRDSYSPSDGGISVSIAAREDVVLRLKDKILSIIAGTQPWYNIIACFDSFNYLLFFPIVFGLSIFIAVKISAVKMELEDQFISFISLTSIIFVIFSIMYFAFFFKLLKWLFPSGIFTIGQGKSRFETLKRIQWSVAIAFAVSLTAGLVVWIIQVIFA